jgi:DNA-binding NarL/FixJ family response regulator
MTARSGDDQKSIRALVAERDSATRTGVKMALRKAGIEVCGEVGTARDLVEAAARLDPDVCLVAVNLPGGGIAAASELGARGRRPAVIMLAGKIEEADFLAAMRAGTAGYLPKSIPPSRLPAVVRGVMRGEPAVPRALVAMLINGLRRRSASRLLVIPDRTNVDLTSREWEVLDLMREGLSTRAIAARLLISEVTVRRHISSVLKKLQVQTRAEALELLQSA